MKKITQLFTAFIITISAAGLLSVAVPQNASAACGERLLTFPTWYNGLVDSNCNVKKPAQTDGGLSRFIWKIVLNIIDMLMQLIGYAAVVFLIIGGFRYITATGEPTKMSAAKTTIMNSVIGLAIALASVAIVNAVRFAI